MKEMGTPTVVSPYRPHTHSWCLQYEYLVVGMYMQFSGCALGVSLLRNRIDSGKPQWINLTSGVQ